jgi:hypothetical protein
MIKPQDKNPDAVCRFHKSTFSAGIAVWQCRHYWLKYFRAESAATRYHFDLCLGLRYGQVPTGRYSIVTFLNGECTQRSCIGESSSEAMPRPVFRRPFRSFPFI